MPDFQQNLVPNLLAMANGNQVQQAGVGAGDALNKAAGALANPYQQPFYQQLAKRFGLPPPGQNPLQHPLTSATMPQIPPAAMAPGGGQPPSFPGGAPPMPPPRPGMPLQPQQSVTPPNNPGSPFNVTGGLY